jgi:hypothetical protein
VYLVDCSYSLDDQKDDQKDGQTAYLQAYWAANCKSLLNILFKKLLDALKTAYIQAY